MYGHCTDLYGRKTYYFDKRVRVIRYFLTLLEWWTTHIISLILWTFYRNSFQIADFLRHNACNIQCQNIYIFLIRELRNPLSSQCKNLYENIFLKSNDNRSNTGRHVKERNFTFYRVEPTQFTDHKLRTSTRLRSHDMVCVASAS